MSHRHPFGWDLPPGCTQRDIDEAAGYYDEPKKEDADMLVDVIDVNGYGEETPRGRCDLSECFPDRDPDSYLDALVKLQDYGEAWIGGGATPLVLLRVVER